MNNFCEKLLYDSLSRSAALDGLSLASSSHTSPPPSPPLPPRIASAEHITRRPRLHQLISQQLLPAGAWLIFCSNVLLYITLHCWRMADQLLYLLYTAIFNYFCHRQKEDLCRLELPVIWPNIFFYICLTYIGYFYL